MNTDFPRSSQYTHACWIRSTRIHAGYRESGAWRETPGSPLLHPLDKQIGYQKTSFYRALPLLRKVLAGERHAVGISSLGFERTRYRIITARCTRRSRGVSRWRSPHLCPTQGPGLADALRALRRPGFPAHSSDQRGGPARHQPAGTPRTGPGRGAAVLSASAATLHGLPTVARDDPDGELAARPLAGAWPFPRWLLAWRGDVF